MHHKYILIRKLPVGEKIVLATDVLSHALKEMKDTPGLIMHSLNDDHGGYDPIELGELTEYNPEET